MPRLSEMASLLFFMRLPLFLIAKNVIILETYTAIGKRLQEEESVDGARETLSNHLHGANLKSTGTAKCPIHWRTQVSRCFYTSSSFFFMYSVDRDLLVRSKYHVIRAHKTRVHFYMSIIDSHTRAKNSWPDVSTSSILVC